ncbi:MAG: tol-pal system-associated acyl-CoA thioesterase [Janthinobacterium lividum]
MTTSQRSARAAERSRSTAFTWPLRVYYEDTDAGGIVFYANYLKFFERARTEMLRAGGIERGRLSADTGTVFVVRSTALDYLAAARLDDALEVDTEIARLGGASVDFAQSIWRGEVLIAQGSIRVACVDRSTLRPIKIPAPVIAALSPRSTVCSNDLAVASRGASGMAEGQRDAPKH